MDDARLASSGAVGSGDVVTTVSILRFGLIPGY
jgi:hypothetical protein